MEVSEINKKLLDAAEKLKQSMHENGADSFTLFHQIDFFRGIANSSSWTPETKQEITVLLKKISDSIASGEITCTNTTGWDSRGGSSWFFILRTIEVLTKKSHRNKIQYNKYITIVCKEFIKLWESLGSSYAFEICLHIRSQKNIGIKYQISLIQWINSQLENFIAAKQKQGINKTEAIKSLQTMPVALTCELLLDNITDVDEVLKAKEDLSLRSKKLKKALEEKEGNKAYHHSILQLFDNSKSYTLHNKKVLTKLIERITEGVKSGEILLSLEEDDNEAIWIDILFSISEYEGFRRFSYDDNLVIKDSSHIATSLGEEFLTLWDNFGTEYAFTLYSEMDMDTIETMDVEDIERRIWRFNNVELKDFICYNKLQGISEEETMESLRAMSPTLAYQILKQ